MPNVNLESFWQLWESQVFLFENLATALQELAAVEAPAASLLKGSLYVQGASCGSCMLWPAATERRQSDGQPRQWLQSPQIVRFTSPECTWVNHGFTES